MNGQLPGGDSSAASDSKLLYSMTLSTEVIWFSTSVDCLTPHWNEPASIIAEDIASPASLPVIPIKTVLMKWVNSINMANVESSTDSSKIHIYCLVRWRRRRWRKWCKPRKSSRAINQTNALMRGISTKPSCAHLADRQRFVEIWLAIDERATWPIHSMWRRDAWRPDYGLV